MGPKKIVKKPVIKVNEEKLKEIKAAEIREQRDKFISDCDWTMMSDAPTDKEAWTKYRQALRDITSQEGFPLEVTWPEPPEQ